MANVNWDEFQARKKQLFIGKKMENEVVISAKLYLKKESLKKDLT